MRACIRIRFVSDLITRKRWVTNPSPTPPHNLPAYHSPLPSTMQYKLALLSAGFSNRFVELTEGVDSGFSQYSTFFSTILGGVIQSNFGAYEFFFRRCIPCCAWD